MCGRFTLALPAETIRDFLALARMPELTPRYNIAPSQPVAVARFDVRLGERSLQFVRWGLVPRWAKDPSIGQRLINARAETLAEKPAFRAPFRERRCLIPADGFYEWQKVDGQRQPFHIRRRDGGPLAMAGLWESWLGPDGETLESCAIITTSANELVQPIHDRMPVLLPEDAFELWLDPTVTDLKRLSVLLRPADPEPLIAVPVSRRVNRPDAEGPELVMPLGSARQV